MCILRYLPATRPSVSKTTAVLWYRPVARFSNSELTSTTPCCFARRDNRFVLAEVRAVVQFLQQHELRATLRRFGHARFDGRQVGVGIALVAFLDERDGERGL